MHQDGLAEGVLQGSICVLEDATSEARMQVEAAALCHPIPNSEPPRGPLECQAGSQALPPPV